MTVRELQARWSWIPMRNCPGRYVLATPDAQVPLAEMVEPGSRVHVCRSPRARDRVLVVPLEDGGVISYQRSDGSLVHTLNTPEGFARKLADLRITLEEASEHE